jgi:hypothetical protein
MSRKIEFTGTYVGLRLALRSGQQLLDALPEICPKRRIAVNDMHITLLYAENQAWRPDIKPGYPEGVIIDLANPRFELFGDKHDTLVITFTSSFLQNRHSYICHKYGLSHSYPNYSPHVTIAYDWPGGLIPCPRRLPQIRVFEYVDPLKSDWSEGK